MHRVRRREGEGVKVIMIPSGFKRIELKANSQRGKRLLSSLHYITIATLSFIETAAWAKKSSF
jgi:hypothetical protein